MAEKHEIKRNKANHLLQFIYLINNWTIRVLFDSVLKKNNTKFFHGYHMAGGHSKKVRYKLQDTEKCNVNFKGIVRMYRLKYSILYMFTMT